MKREVIYPESDGKPMADNTKQARWIIFFYDNLVSLYVDSPEVFVAADNMWYPVEGEETICLAPDVYVAFGRPKGDRKSYKQWEEGGVPLTVVFEILSPSNTVEEMMEKRDLYEEHGVEEYYVYNPDTGRLKVYVRGRMGGALVRQRFQGSFISPRMGIRFDTSGPELRVSYPNGESFVPFEDLKKQRDREAARAKAAEERAASAEERATTAEERATTAEERAASAKDRADAAETRLARLAELSRKARRGLASPEELAEIEQLEGPG